MAIPRTPFGCVLKVAHQGDLTATSAILALVDHQDGRVRLAAVEALGRLGRRFRSRPHSHGLCLEVGGQTYAN